MKSVFADSYYYLALINPRDKAHAKAVAFAETTHVVMVTTAWILAEVGDAMSSVVNRRKFLLLVDTLNLDPLVEVIPTSEEWFERGLRVYRTRPDKEWGLTDCISFAVMQEFGLSDALTGDHHFAQAGFKPLLAN